MGFVATAHHKHDIVFNRTRKGDPGRKRYKIRIINKVTRLE